MRKRQARIAAFAQALEELGWTEGRNVQIDYRWAAGNADAFADTRRNWSRLRRMSSWRPARERGGRCSATRTVPIVFVQRPRSGRRRLCRELGAAGRQRHRLYPFRIRHQLAKWLELLKEIAPALTRVAVLRDPAIAAGIGQLAAIQSVAPSLGVDVTPVNVRDASEIERAIAAFARSRMAA